MQKGQLGGTWSLEFNLILHVIFDCTYLNPNIRQATLASLLSQLSSQTVPQTPSLRTSTLPYVRLPCAFLKRIISNEKVWRLISWSKFWKIIFFILATYLGIWLSCKLYIWCQSRHKNILFYIVIFKSWHEFISTLIPKGENTHLGILFTRKTRYFWQ